MFRSLTTLVAVPFACLIFCLTYPSAHASIFGEENIALMKLVVGQIIEIERLAATLQVEREQKELLEALNAGALRTIQQLEAIEEIVERAKGLEPKNIRRISDLTAVIEEVKSLKRRVEDVLEAKIAITNNAIAQSALQSETAYTTGQEVMREGTVLADEAQWASPGRAAQISATAGTAQMFSSGATLQVLSHIAQLQALSLDLQKTQFERELIASRTREDYFRSELSNRIKESN